MNTENLKIIIKNLELWTEALKSEVYSETTTIESNPNLIQYDYDEVFEE